MHDACVVSIDMAALMCLYASAIDIKQTELVAHQLDRHQLLLLRI